MGNILSGDNTNRLMTWRKLPWHPTCFFYFVADFIISCWYGPFCTKLKEFICLAILQVFKWRLTTTEPILDALRKKLMLPSLSSHHGAKHLERIPKIGLICSNEAFLQSHVWSQELSVVSNWMLCSFLQLPYGFGVSNLQCLVNNRAICWVRHWNALLDGEWFL